MIRNVFFGCMLLSNLSSNHSYLCYAGVEREGIPDIRGEGAEGEEKGGEILKRRKRIEMFC